MGAITISREYGSDGRTVGQKVAEILACLYVEKELIVEVARRAEVPAAELERFDEHPENTAVRVLRKLLMPKYDETLYGAIGYGWGPSDVIADLPTRGTSLAAEIEEDDYVRMTQEVMMQLAYERDVVLIGRGSQALLGFSDNALHVRLVAPLEFRIETVVKRDGLGHEKAHKQIRKVDEARRLYIKRHYGIEWDDPQHYHMILNTCQVGVEETACLIADAARYMAVERQSMVGN